MPSLNYQDALRILDYYAFLPWQPAPDEERPARARALLAALHKPHMQYPVIHVTGTKGKGSVCAMTAAILQEAGLRVGVYSSPHLQDVRERFQINGQLAPEADLARAVAAVEAVAEQIPGLHWPEVMVALASLIFAQHRVDIAIYEVGHGGRIDATNVFDAPLLSVITPISYDHVDRLGHTLAAIATEKSGIIKAGRPVISAPQDEEALAVLAAISAERNSPLTLVGRDFTYQAGAASLAGQEILTGSETYLTLLRGRHQATNMAVTLGIIGILKQQGYRIDRIAIQEGLRRAWLPGRFEIVRETPAVILDSAHNHASARVLREALADLFPERRVILVFAAKAAKDIDGMLAELLPVCRALILTRAGQPPTSPPERLQSFVDEADFRGDVYQMPESAAAITQAFEVAGADGLICITGSMFLVGEARTFLGLPPGSPV